MDQEQHDHDRGLSFDLDTLLSRRRAFKVIGAVGLAAFVGCSSDSSSTTTALSTAASSAAAGACDTIPEETGGPYPADGSNGPNVLTESGIVRSDITSSFGSSTTKAQGVPLTIDLTLQDAAACSALAGAAVYLWHCDREGRYSLYSQGATNENYLRGVQDADADGRLTFTSIYPACYAGRWPHIHFEVYPSLSEATKAGAVRATSQIALPKATSDLVYATSGYEQSVRNASQVSLSSDMVFRDGVELQTPTVTGDVASGFTIALTVAT